MTRTIACRYSHGLATIVGYAVVPTTFEPASRDYGDPLAVRVDGANRYGEALELVYAMRDVVGAGRYAVVEHIHGCCRVGDYDAYDLQTIPGPCEACGTTDRVTYDAHGWFCVACRDSDEGEW